MSEQLPGEIQPAYLYAVVTIVTIELTLQGGAYLTGEPLYIVQNPFSVLQPIGLLFAVYGSRALRGRYQQVMREMKIEKRTAEHERLFQIVPDWLPWAFFVLGIGVNYVRPFSIGGPLVVYQEANLSAVIRFTVANPIWLSIRLSFSPCTSLSCCSPRGASGSRTSESTSSTPRDWVFFDRSVN